MCGIFGVISYNLDNLFTRDDLINAFNLLSHRGPDVSKYEVCPNSFIGHKRLSIIDTSELGNQPFYSSDRKVCISYNGEIYNFKELKSELKKYIFVSKTDTEVILAGYLLEGINFFKKLRGMYAISILDESDINNKKLILVRDPSGIKPLYYYSDKSKFIFSSEIKSIKYLLINDEKKINFDVIKYYISLGYCPDPLTVYENVFCVKAGEFIEVKLNSLQTKSKIFYNHLERTSFEESEPKNIECYLNNAIQLNSVSDVPITYALSGGVDSSLIVAISQKLGLNPHTFTVGFNDAEFNESYRAKLFANKLGVKNTVIQPNFTIGLELITKIFDNFDQPYSDTSAIPFYILTNESKFISKVLIGGDGGNELFNGYPSMNWIGDLERWKPLVCPFIYQFSKFNFLPKSRELKRIAGLLHTNNFEEMICKWQSWFPSDLTYNGKSIYKYHQNSIFPLFESLYHDDNVKTNSNKIFHSYFYKRMIGDYLRKTDMVSMQNSVEYRVPLLDEDLIKKALTIPYSKNKDKMVLKNIHAKYFPGKDFQFKKSGFGIPLDRYLDSSSINEIYSLVTNTNGIVLDLFQKDYIDYLFSILGKGDNDMNSRGSIYQKIIILYSLQNWFLNKQ